MKINFEYLSVFIFSVKSFFIGLFAVVVLGILLAFASALGAAMMSGNEEFQKLSSFKQIVIVVGIGAVILFLITKIFGGLPSTPSY
jgi:hypothetical protein